MFEPNYYPAQQPPVAEPAAPVPNRRWPWIAGIFAALILGIAAGLGIGAATGLGAGGESAVRPDTPTSEQVTISSEMAADQARSACQKYVKERLKSPGSAQFSDTTTEKHSDSLFTIKGAVDSQNGFGALIRNTYSCKVTGYKGDWSLIGEVQFTGKG